MKKFTITNSQNEKISVDLVRYFKFKNDCYLIYTMNEKDEKNYLKLYLVRIMEELGFPIVQLIKNDNDWAGMQNIIKKVIKEIKCENYRYLQDLDYKTIDGIKVTEARFFKLDPKLTAILSSNYFDEDSYSPSSTNDANSIGDGENNNANEYNDSMTNVPINTIGIDNSVNIETIEPLETVIYNETGNINGDVVFENNLDMVASESVQNVNYLNVDNINENHDNVDYKTLYLAAKKEIEVSNELTDDLLEQLLKYKEKYGELEK